VTADDRGADMFARYAYAPNALGYCGPRLGTTLHELSVAEVRAAAARFSGAWPYLQVLSRMTGIADPLDARLVESYWLGGGVGEALDPDEFTRQLLAVIGPQAGRYWSHLTCDLAREAVPNHCFHVFGVYPWSRLLGKGMDEHPIRILDSCRISWGAVVGRQADAIDVRGVRLIWEGGRLGLSEPGVRPVQVWVDGHSAVPDVAAGDVVALHWDRLCGRLDPAQLRDLEATTRRQLDVTNRRLAA
jgi:hypothetical protein